MHCTKFPCFAQKMRTVKADLARRMVLGNVLRRNLTKIKRKKKKKKEKENRKLNEIDF